LAGLSSVDAIAFATSQGSAIISIGHGDEAERKKTHSTWEALVLLEWQVRNTAICKATSKKSGDFGQPSTCCWWAEGFFLVEHGLRVKTQRERKKTPTGGWQENIEPMQTRKHMTRWNQAIWLACWYNERDSAVFHNWTEPYDSDIIARRFQCHSRLAMPAMSATNSCTNDTELADHDKRVSHTMVQSVRNDQQLSSWWTISRTRHANEMLTFFVPGRRCLPSLAAILATRRLIL
jgi:hypothetical protein